MGLGNPCPSTRQPEAVTTMDSLIPTVNTSHARSVVGMWKHMPGSSGMSTPWNRLITRHSPQSGAKRTPSE